MSSSPYISESLRNYLTKFDIENLINQCINSVCREMPTDPYSYIINTFQKNASSDIQILKITATQIYNSDLVPVLSLRVQVRYMEKEITVDLPPLGIVNDQPVHLYDEDRQNGKGLNKGIEFVEEINTVLKDKICSKQAEIDSTLVSAYQTKGSKGLYQINICSYLAPLVTNKITNTPLYEVFRDLFGSKITSMKVCINALQGSKLVNSKCKAFKYMIMCDELTDPMSIINVIQSIKKSIVTGKGGEAALKYAPDGTFICPVDTIADNLKIVQDAINANSNTTKDKLSIGINWMADNFFNPDQKKYELENPKALLDADQLIQYYFKLSNDRPLITYIEDPVFSQDPVAWNKVQKKFENGKVRIGSRKIFSTVDEIKQNSPVTKQEKPEMEEAQITELNTKKIRINCHWYKPYELMTLSSLIDVSRELRRQNVVMILGENLIQTTDTTLTDLCYATGAFMNLSCPLKFNQINKLNRISEILKD